MRLLLDENLPHQIRLELSGHEVVTAAFYPALLAALARLSSREFVKLSGARSRASI